MARSLPVLMAWLAAACAAATGPVASQASLRIVVLGDSTVCDYNAPSPTRGWGQYLAEGFTQPVAVRNLAVSGRSTKTFLQEGRLKKALAEKADYALIQFGHNDSHGKGRPEATDADTAFKDNLRTYVDAFVAAGTVPILVTPMHRRTFKNGKVTEELRPYAEAMKAVAAEKKVALVDLYARSGALFDQLGDAGTADLSTNAKDCTHFSAKGARVMARLVREELRKVDARLGSALK